MSIVSSSHSALDSNRRWIQRIDRGEVDGWSLTQVAAAPDAFPSLRASLTTGDRLLARVTTAHVGEGAYRKGQELEPVALIKSL